MNDERRSWQGTSIIGYPTNTEARKARVQAARTERQQKEHEKHQAYNVVQTIAANVDNVKLSDTEFRDFIRQSMAGIPGVNYNAK
jgi:hypothetical protein